MACCLKLTPSPHFPTLESQLCKFARGLRASICAMSVLWVLRDFGSPYFPAPFAQPGTGAIAASKASTGASCAASEPSKQPEAVETPGKKRHFCAVREQSRHQLTQGGLVPEMADRTAIGVAESLRYFHPERLNCLVL